MDLAMVSIDMERMEMEYSGANCPLYLVRKGMLQELKPDKMAIASFEPGDAAVSDAHPPLDRRRCDLCGDGWFSLINLEGQTGRNSCGNGSGNYSCMHQPFQCQKWSKPYQMLSTNGREMRTKWMTYLSSP